MKYSVFHVDCEAFATIVDWTEATTPREAIDNVLSERELQREMLCDAMVFEGHLSPVHDSVNGDD